MDVKWANLSIEITKQNKLSLKMRQAPVDMLQQNDINDVDFDVINEWRKSQKDEVEALKHLDVK